jgi:hypothetical protein
MRGKKDEYLMLWGWSGQMYTKFSLLAYGTKSFYPFCLLLPRCPIGKRRTAHITCYSFLTIPSSALYSAWKIICCLPGENWIIFCESCRKSIIEWYFIKLTLKKIIQSWFHPLKL